MNKSELVAKLATQNGVTKAFAESFLDSLGDIIKSTLKAGEKLQLVGYGTFEVVEKETASARIPGTNVSVISPAHKVIKFRISRALRDLFK